MLFPLPWLLSSRGGVSSHPAYAGFLGDTLTGTWNCPSISSIYSNSGTGFTGPGAASPSVSFFFEGASATVSDTQIVETGAVGFYTATAFNGFVITDLTASNVTGVSINGASDFPGFSASDLSFTSNSISINNAGLTPIASDQLVLDVTFAGVPGVPEPVSLSLLGAGLIGLGVAADAPQSLKAASHCLEQGRCGAPFFEHSRRAMTADGRVSNPSC